ncbi:uncharacterized protein BT62DRAFT_928122 [Guyanagaster necrorhizus]|uniref:Uncharacterized protein n=1 Tax=Guyanagaster necrorhizus TaxID=856835 RepID=A0A9P7W1E8_9AGAR|nr:uncharacterized protein BT62DRAFT_928122 [Guyanagaster necrorhizus MCA 3950]KAG7450842.1 hypothetical protein BT62DRAFT_928122 [Guyanagaster necrorhizus MCA 3950]
MSLYVPFHLDRHRCATILLSGQQIPASGLFFWVIFVDEKRRDKDEGGIHQKCMSLRQTRSYMGLSSACPKCNDASSFIVNKKQDIARATQIVCCHVRRTIQRENF